MDIGQKVREFRKGMGMPQAELARRAGVTRHTIVMIETGGRTPSVGLLEKLARELRVEPAELLKEPAPLKAESRPGRAPQEEHARSRAEAPAVTVWQMMGGELWPVILWNIPEDQRDAWRRRFDAHFPQGYDEEELDSPRGRELVGAANG